MEVWEFAETLADSDVTHLANHVDGASPDQVVEVFDAIKDQEVGDIDDLEVDSLVEIYNWELHDWAGSSIYNAGWVEEAIGNYGFSDFYSALQQGQYEQYRAIAHEVFEFLTEGAEDYEEEEE